MEQLGFEILLNPSVPAEEELRLSRQAHAIYYLFMTYYKLGLPVPNTELMKIGFQYQARLYEVRRALIPFGWCIDLMQKGEDGMNFYSLVPLGQSKFFSEHKTKVLSAMSDYYQNHRSGRQRGRNRANGDRSDLQGGLF